MDRQDALLLAPLREALRREWARSHVAYQPSLVSSSGGALSVRARFDIHRMGPAPIALKDALDARGGASDAFVAWAAALAVHHARYEAWREQMGGDANAHDPPPWMRLAHPLFRLAHALDPERLRATTSSCADMMQGSITVVPGPPHVGLHQVDTLDRAMEVQIGAVMPDSALVALAGRPLSDLVELPSSGDPSIDADVAALVIERTRSMPTNRIGARLRPATWLPLEAAPDGVRADWHLTHPLIL